MQFFDLNHLHLLIHYIHDHPTLAELLTFGIAFIESLALIGGLFPGSVTMTAIGALIGSGTMSAMAIVFAALGAFLGDFLSYGIGAYYNERLPKMWPFRKYPKWLKAGRDFFVDHGGKSVLIGRFFGPVRSVVPLVAGLMHMSVGRFTLSAAIASILWSLLYIAPGIVVGALSLELPPTTATKFILIVLSIVAFGWIILVLFHLFLKKLIIAIDASMNHLWHWLQQHALTAWLPRLLSPSPSHPYPYRQLNLLFFSIACFSMGLWILHGVVVQNYLTHLNQPIVELLRSLRTQMGDTLMLIFTLLGAKQTQLTAAVLIGLWLTWKRHYRVAFYWACLVFIDAGVGYLCKYLMYVPRPTGLLTPQISSSFPSGHVLLTTGLLSFLAMVFSAHPMTEHKTDTAAISIHRPKAPWRIAMLLILAVSISRLYLGAHWLTDVLASLFIGLGCATAVYLFYARQICTPNKHADTTRTLCTALTFTLRHRLKKLENRHEQNALIKTHTVGNPYPSSALWAPSPTRGEGEINTAIVLIFLTCWLMYGAMMFKTQQKDSTLYWPMVNMDTKTWWQQPYPEEEPLFLLSRVGKPQAALNVQWLGALDRIQQILTTQGWQAKPARLNWKNSFNRLSPKKNPEHLPILPWLYQNQAPVLMMTKWLDQTSTPLYFVLWKSNITIPDSPQPLWVGSVHYFIPNPHKNGLKLTPAQTQQLYSQAVQALMQDLRQADIPTQVKKWQISPDQQSPLMSALHWDGQLLFVRFS